MLSIEFGHLGFLLRPIISATKVGENVCVFKISWGLVQSVGSDEVEEERMHATIAAASLRV